MIIVKKTKERKMKMLRLLIVAAAFFAAVCSQQEAFADAIGGGSIRVTAAEAGAEIKIRYRTEQGTVEKTVADTEVLHLSTFEVVDEGGQFPVLNPTANQFILYKDETTGFILTGGSDVMVRLSFDEEGIQEELLLDFQWTPKLEILTSPADKVEVLDASDDLLNELGEDTLFLSSNNGMAIRFVVPEAEDQGGTDSGDDQGPGGELVPADEAASGGCSMASGFAGNLGGGWLMFLPLALAAVRRIRRK
jgi:hypothetical protein